MYKNTSSILVYLSYFFVIPQVTNACSYQPFIRPDSLLMLSVVSVLFIFHGIFLYKLNRETDLATKEKAVRQYSSSLFNLYILIPGILFLGFIFTNLAFACMDSYSGPGALIDNPVIVFLFVVIISIVTSLFYILLERSNKLSAEMKIRVGKVIAALQSIIMLVSIIFLAYTAWVFTYDETDNINESIFEIPIPK